MRTYFYLSILGLGCSLASPCLSWAEQSPEFIQAWKAFAEDSTSITTQALCRPQWLRANPSVPFRGTILLHHGFTACGQQFVETAEQQLVPHGYDVLLTLLPGHGGQWNDQGEDPIDGMMNQKNWRKISAEYSTRVNHVMSLAAGEKIIGGLSVGGELAALSILMEPQLYDRAFLFSPFLRFTRKPQAMLLDFFGSGTINTVLSFGKHKMTNIRSGWGKTCQGAEREGGRAGTCEFRLTHLTAIQLLGKSLTKRASHTPALRTRIDLVVIDHDRTARASTSIRFLKDLDAAEKTVCLLPKGINHSFLSRFDSPTEDKYWIAPIQAGLGEALASGSSLKNTLSLCAQN